MLSSLFFWKNVKIITNFTKKTFQKNKKLLNFLEYVRQRPKSTGNIKLFLYFWIFVPVFIILEEGVTFWVTSLKNCNIYLFDFALFELVFVAFIFIKKKKKMIADLVEFAGCFSRMIFFFLIIFNGVVERVIKSSKWDKVSQSLHGSKFSSVLGYLFLFQNSEELFYRFSNFILWTKKEKLNFNSIYIYIYIVCVCLVLLKKSVFFFIQFIFTTIYVFYCIFWYYLWILLHYFSYLLC